MALSDLSSRDSSLVRKLTAAGTPIVRARQLDNMITGMRATIADNAFCKNLGSDDLLPVFALMLGEMLAVNSLFVEHLTEQSQAEWVRNSDVMNLIAVAQSPDPNPKEIPELKMILEELERYQKRTGINDRDLFEEEAADMAEAAGQPLQQLGKA